MKYLSCVVILLCLCAIGCKQPMASKNKLMAYSDSGAVLTTAVALDQAAPEKFDAVKVDIMTACADVSKFLDDGKISDLPVEKARQVVVDYMVKKGWQAYIGLVDVAFAWISAQTVPTEKLGADNILIVKQGLEGAARQAGRARKDWAKPIGTANVDTTKGKSLKIGGK